jgi:hypothetical protein|tara:strand:+ start:160 stop:369 length:210 start_codon:yes stop_codon:yes gene_type:complete
MYIEKLSIECFSDYQIEGKKPESVQIGSFTSDGCLGADSEKVEAMVEALGELYGHDPVRLVVTYETSNT